MGIVVERIKTYGSFMDVKPKYKITNKKCVKTCLYNMIYNNYSIIWSQCVCPSSDRYLGRLQTRELFKNTKLIESYRKIKYTQPTLLAYTYLKIKLLLKRWRAISFCIVSSIKNNPSTWTHNKKCMNSFLPFALGLSIVCFYLQNSTCFRVPFITVQGWR